MDLNAETIESAKKWIDTLTLADCRKWLTCGDWAATLEKEDIEGKTVHELRRMMKDLLYEDPSYVLDSLIMAGLDPEAQDELFGDEEERAEVISNLKRFVSVSKNKEQKDLSVRFWDENYRGRTCHFVAVR